MKLYQVYSPVSGNEQNRFLDCSTAKVEVAAVSGHIEACDALSNRVRRLEG